MSMLDELELTKTEQRIYLALVEIGSAKAGLLCNKAQIPKSNIYELLEKLIDKGLVSFQLKNNIKVFYPAPPKILEHLYQEKQNRLKEGFQELQKTISHLEAMHKTADKAYDFQFFEGIHGVKSMWEKINAHLTQESSPRYFTTKKESYERLIGFYSEHQKLRAQLGCPAKLILPIEDVELGIKRQKENTSVRYLSLTNDAEWGVIGEYVYIQYITSKNPKAFLIKDVIISQTFRMVYDMLFSSAKEL